MRDDQTQHLRFAVHTTNHQGDMVELFNTGMMEVEEFMCTSPTTTTTMPTGCDDAVHSKVLLDFSTEVVCMCACVCAVSVLPVKDRTH
jgi:hypothetical protein